MYTYNRLEINLKTLRIENPNDKKRERKRQNNLEWDLIKK